MGAEASLYGRIPTTIRLEGGEYVNPAKYYQKTFWLQASQKALSASESTDTTLTPPRDQGDEGDTELLDLTAKSTGKFAVKLYDQVIDKWLSNQPVESSLVFGHGNLPARLLEPIWVPATTSLIARLEDLSGSSNTIDLNGTGTQVLNPQANLGLSRQELLVRGRAERRHAYWLTFDSGAEVTIEDGNEEDHVMTVPSDADFNAWALLYRSDRDISFEVIEGQRRSQMSSGDPVAGELIASKTLTSASAWPGSIIPAAGMPYIWPTTHLYPRNTRITLRIKNSSGQDATVSIAFVGQLVYYPVAPEGMTHLQLERGGRPLPPIRPRGPLLQGYQGTPMVPQSYAQRVRVPTRRLY